MKKILYYILSAAVALSLSSCLEDMKGEDVLHGSKELTVSIDLPEALENEDKADFKVTLRNTKTGSAYVTQTDAEGQARLDAEFGNYSLIVSKEIEVDGVVKYLRASQDLVLSKDENPVAEAVLEIKSSNKGTIILKEVYFHKSKVPATGKTYLYDQYFTLYNNSDKVQYLDGIGLGFHTQFNSNDKINFPKFWFEGSTEPRDSVPVNAFGLVFPGKGDEHPLQPGEEVVMALSAINHTAEMTETPLDFTGDNVWAVYIDNTTTAQKAPVSGVNRMTCFCQLAAGKTIIISDNSPVVVVYRIEGDPFEYVKDGPVSGQPYGNVMYQPTAYKSMPSIMVPKEWVYDAVEFKKDISHLTRLPSEISLEPLFIETKAASGVSYIRRVDEAATAAAGHTVYQDTNNSKEDWVAIEHPTLYKGN